MPTWIRCRDPETRHEFDLHEEDVRLADGSVELVKGYPKHSGLTAQPRPPKYHVRKDGKPATRAAQTAETAKE